MRSRILLSLFAACIPAAAQTPAYLIDSNLDQLFSVDLTTGAATLIGSTVGVLGTPAGLTWRPDTQTLWTIDLAGGEVGTLDTTTGAFTTVFTAVPANGWQGIDYDMTTGQFFLLNQDFNMYRLDPTTGVTTLLGATGAPLMTAIETDIGGTLWGIGFSNGLLYQVNKLTGVATPGATTAPVNFQGMSFGAGGQLYGSNTTTDALYTIDTTTGATVLVGLHGAGVQFGKGFEVAFTPGSGTVATKVRYGTGGGGSNASLYENFASPATFDLNNTNFQFDEQPGGGWTVSAGSAAVSAAGATPLVLSDDSEVAQALSSGFAPSVQVCSNGFISVGGSNGTGFTPDVNTFLNAAFESWRVWHDYNPGAAGSGQVKYQFLNNEDVVTWDGVYDFAGPNPNTLQFRMSVVGGQRRMVISIVQMSGLGNAILLGYSPAGVSVDPLSTDLSAATLPISLGATDVGPVFLDADARPVIGTNITLTTTNIPAGSLGVATQFSGLQNLLGLDLGFMGAPGNRFYLGSIDGSFGVASLPVAIPNNASLVGAFLYWQSAVVKLGVNPANLLTSNGLSLRIGNL